ncbi:glycoside hydrolase family 28 protein [Myriangium duriaei CBS 260.36]|uniref:galacturonan 1,4-alpha-galacturonidase n=1 Tax=Myriangium duriaei CBS 260.36 TaxID=1168546 RepID=A0A9P4MHN8_9PEZI|nr:glycoside hydrolase family 28 protein [Myriangium duriaei CBS 260.36]
MALIKGALALFFLTLLSLATAQSRSKTCVVPSKYAASNGTADDSPAIQQALAKCSRDAVIKFTLGANYSVLTPIVANNLSNVELSMLGNLHLPQNVTRIQALVNATGGNNQAGSLYWFTFNGSCIDYISTSNVTTGWINSYGQQWWDLNPKNGTGTPARPHLMKFTTLTGSLQHFKSWKPIGWNVALSGKNIMVNNAIIDAHSTGAFPFNTDGFDVSGSNIIIQDSVIYNGDDAVAIGSGATNITFRRNVIGYQSHGMSIGSLGQNQAIPATVSNILFDDNVAVNSLYGARFKSWIGGQGLAKNVTWSNIRLYNVTQPILVTQTYTNQGSNQTQLTPGQVTGRPNNSSVLMQDFNFINFTGSINSYQPGDGSCVTDPCWYDTGLTQLDGTQAVIVECNTNSSCKNFRFENIQVWPQKDEPASVVCINATAALNPKLGFDCRNGTFVPLA